MGTSLPEQLAEQVALRARLAELERELKARDLLSDREAYDEVVRRMALEVFGGQPVREPGFDLIDDQRRAVLALGLVLTAGRTAEVEVTAAGFDVVALVRMDRATLRIEWAREIPASVFTANAALRNRRWRMSIDAARTLGDDVTDDFRDAWDALKLQP